jgi:hypothetical protein
MLQPGTAKLETKTIEAGRQRHREKRKVPRRQGETKNKQRAPIVAKCMDKASIASRLSLNGFLCPPEIARSNGLSRFLSTLHDTTVGGMNYKRINFTLRSLLEHHMLDVTVRLLKRSFSFSLIAVGP